MGLRSKQRQAYSFTDRLLEWYHASEWCGPYISNGKFQSSVPGTVVPRNADQVRCKYHDISMYECKSRECFEAAHKAFYDDSRSAGLFGRASGTAVKWFGNYFNGPITEGKRKAEDPPPDPSKRLRSDSPENSKKRRAEGTEEDESNKKSRGNPSKKRAASHPSSSQRNIRRRHNPSNQSHPLAPLFGPLHNGDMGTQGEIGLMPFGKPAQYAPQYFTTKLKWMSRECFKSDTGTLVKREFRINSPLDPNYLATDKTDALANSTFNGWSEYANRYKYYRLINNKVRVEFLFPEDTYGASSLVVDQNESRVAWPRVCGVALNPGRMFPYSNAGVNSMHSFINGKFVDYKTSVGRNVKEVFTIDYDPLAWNTPVAEQQREVFWTSVKQNPLVQDHFHVFAQNFQFGGANLSVPPALTFILFITMEVTVQFREWSDETISRSLAPDTRTTDDTGTTSQATGPASTDEVMQTAPG